MRRSDDLAALPEKLMHRLVDAGRISRRSSGSEGISDWDGFTMALFCAARLAAAPAGVAL